LGNALLGNIQSSQYFDAGNDAFVLDRYGDLKILQYAINSDTNEGFVFERFNMNIACTRLNRMGNDGLPRPNNRKVIIFCSQINTVP
jgi:hypothetical protein